MRRGDKKQNHTHNSLHTVCTRLETNVIRCVYNVGSTQLYTTVCVFVYTAICLVANAELTTTSSRGEYCKLHEVCGIAFNNKSSEEATFNETNTASLGIVLTFSKVTVNVSSEMSAG